MVRNKRKKARVQLKHTPPGASPGTIISPPGAHPSFIDLFAYGPGEFLEKRIEDWQEVRDALLKFPIVWVNIEGLANSDLVMQAGDIFNIHRLALEDVMSMQERSKLEHYGENTFFVVHMAEMKEQLGTEKLSIYTGKNFVVTFQDGPIDVLSPVRERIRKGTGLIRKSGTDYLTYALVDAVIDSYFPVLEVYGDMLDALEEGIIENPQREMVAQIHSLKKEFFALKRMAWSLRDAISAFVRDTSPLYSPETRIYFRDCYDHIITVLDFVETYREFLSDLMDIYLSSLSNRMNEIMKVLAIFTSVFVPPTLIAGIYGMNFHTQVSQYNMPELTWRYGYPYALGLMFTVSLCILAFLYWKGWLGSLKIRSK